MPDEESGRIFLFLCESYQELVAAINNLLLPAHFGDFSQTVVAANNSLLLPEKVMPAVTLTIPHKLGREAAKARIENRLIDYRTKIEKYVSGISYRWDTDYQLNFSLTYAFQTIRGSGLVRESDVLIELELPSLLMMLAGGVRPRIESEMALLLS